ncbi:MAG TPA: hypothetical protein VL359_09880, partial [bacterium]|nr:hypothetical protein [bacterium]
MLHLVVVAYVACFAGGVTLVVVSALAARHLALPTLREFAILVAAFTLILLAEAARTYQSAVGVDFGAGLDIAAVLLSVAGNLGVGWYLPTVALTVVRAEPSRARSLLLAVLASTVGLLGGLRAASFLLWPAVAAALVRWSFGLVALAAVHVLAGGILLAGFHRIQHARLQLVIRTFLIYLGVFAVL